MYNFVTSAITFFSKNNYPTNKDLSRVPENNGVKNYSRVPFTSMRLILLTWINCNPNIHKKLHQL